jgi:hypothetical protein
MKIYAAPLWFLLAVATFKLWQQTGDLYWTLASIGFALASIRSSIRLLKDVNRQ